MKSTQKYEMYMPNAKNQRQGPNATYIPLGFCVRGNANFMFLRRGKRKFYVLRRGKHIFRYQHVGISKAKFWRRGHCPTPTPDARYFASQWNRGFILLTPNNHGVPTQIAAKVSSPETINGKTSSTQVPELPCTCLSGLSGVTLVIPVDKHKQDLPPQALIKHW